MDRFYIILALLPFYLLINLLLSQEFIRKKHIKMLTFCYSTFLTCFNNYLIKEFYERKQIKNNKERKNRHMTLFDHIWCKKYILLMISLVKALIDQKWIKCVSISTFK